MDDSANPYQPPLAELRERTVRSPWALVRWLPAVLCGVLGAMELMMGGIAALEIARLYRSRGWDEVAKTGADPGMALAIGVVAVMVVLGSGVLGLLASASWVRRRWWIAVALSVLMYLGGPLFFFLLGYSRLRVAFGP